DKSGRPLSQFLNPAAFALPTIGTTGNLGRGNIQGPPTWTFDVALLRAFRLQENKRLEFRAEAYNVTNTFRPLFTTTGASLFGLSSDIAPTRQNQFSISCWPESSMAERGVLRHFS